MKIKFIAVASIALLALLFFWRVKNSTVTQIESESTNYIAGTSTFVITNNQKKVTVRLAETADPEYQSKWMERNARQEWTNNPMATQYLERIRSDRSYDWRQPISFWGILLDQDMNPIKDATVSFLWNDLSQSGTSSMDTKTSESGMFSLQGKTGKVLSVKIEKSGYRRCRSGSVGFEYADPTDRAYHQPDPERPVLFRLIKRGPAEPLVQRSRMAFRCSDDSGDLHLDLLGQRQVGPDDPEVDLVVHAEHGPIREVDGRRWFDWKVILSVPDGGLLAGTECPPAAPEDGYLPRLEFQGKVEGRYSMDGVDDWFFLKSRDGRHFGRVHLKVSAAPDGGGAPKVYLVEYVLNPAGSRGLEFYSEMDVSVKYYAPR